ncbi:hypothetical protein PROFUN_13134 [Planoprotostelium fungivorum]|uniref:Uncharacterized protein n=1 Tax=Planoprotostelium fungivorum TaxID=1890364 RepID=A0A2P6N527_9EUKA|nr:hypothetical protein PROFUN_13134 [Planoprotostelium fungivorum]
MYSRERSKNSRELGRNPLFALRARRFALTRQYIRVAFTASRSLEDAENGTTDYGNRFIYKGLLESMRECLSISLNYIRSNFQTLRIQDLPSLATVLSCRLHQQDLLGSQSSKVTSSKERCSTVRIYRIKSSKDTQSELS